MANRDAILSLRIFVQANNTTKTMRFGSDMSVAEVLREISEKSGVEGGKDHGLFSPPNRENGKKGFWLSRNRALRFYAIQNNVRAPCGGAADSAGAARVQEAAPPAEDPPC